MSTTRPTIADVARRAGVSKGAVSFALNDRPGLSAQTRERILAVARDMGWAPDPRARGLTNRRAYALGLIVAKPPRLLDADPFFPAFIAGVQEELAPRGLALVMQVVTDERAERDGYRQLATERRVDGVYLSDLRLDDSRLELVAELGIPAVTLGRPPGDSTIPAVVADDAAGIDAAVDHLVGLGHRRIGHVAGPTSLIHGAGRMVAWEAALARHGLPRGPGRHGDFTPAGGARATRGLLRLAEPPTAILYANDLMAIAGISVAHQLGVRVPDDLSIVGFDDTALAEHVSPALTTVRVDPQRWGRRATRLLLEFIESGRAADVVMPAPSLIVRRSTGPAPAHAAARRPAGRAIASRVTPGRGTTAKPTAGRTAAGPRPETSEPDSPLPEE